jgi:hypothetical protein
MISGFFAEMRGLWTSLGKYVDKWDCLVHGILINHNGRFLVILVEN